MYICTRTRRNSITNSRPAHHNFHHLLLAAHTTSLLRMRSGENGVRLTSLLLCNLCVFFFVCGKKRLTQMQRKELLFVSKYICKKRAHTGTRLLWNRAHTVILNRANPRRSSMKKTQKSIEYDEVMSMWCCVRKEGERWSKKKRSIKKTSNLGGGKNEGRAKFRLCWGILKVAPRITTRPISGFPSLALLECLRIHEERHNTASRKKMKKKT